MSYQIINTGSSLRFTSDDGFFFLLKHDIKAIKYVSDDLIKIETGFCCNGIFIYQSSVSIPFANNATELTAILSGWLKEFSKDSHSPIPDITESGVDAVS
jgi:hypothetical protein